MKYFVGLCAVCLISLQLRAQTLNYYFGNIHSHTSYSDGNKDSATSLLTTPLQAFNYANQSQHIDFYGISEHNHFSAGMRSPLMYRQGIADANTANADGSFVALYGMEWGVISGGGHAIVYGIDSLVGWDLSDYDIFVAQNDYASLWKLINKKLGAFAYLAHPQSTDYTNLFTTTVNASADSAIVGLAMRSGPAFSTNTSYSNPATGTYMTRYNDALKRGYHVGVGIDHDTHNSVFGRQSAGRLVVMAPSLTRTNILDGFKNMRFYASDDWNVKVNFTVAGQPMGSIFTHAGSAAISVTVTDPDGENTSSIAVYSGVPGSGTAPTVLTSNTNSNTLAFTHNLANLATNYYYVQITQADGNVIWTSPIWYKRDNAMTATLPGTSFTTSAVGTVCTGTPISLTDNSTNTPTSWLWNMPGATPSTSTAQNPVITYSVGGQHIVYLTTYNAAGTGATVSAVLNLVPTPVVTISPSSICIGQQATLTASTATSYSWSTGSTTSSITVSPASTTTYTVSGTSGGCAYSQSATLVVHPLPAVPVISMVPNFLVSSASSGNQWQLNGVPIPGETSVAYNVTQPGIYSVVVTDAYGCTSSSLPFNWLVGIKQNENVKGFSAYPNPTTGIVTLTLEQKMTTFSVEVFNELGQEVHNEKFDGCAQGASKTINLSQLAKGVYLIKITSSTANHIDTIIKN